MATYIYTASFVPNTEQVLRKLLPNIEIIYLKTTRADGRTIEDMFECPALEDDDLRSKIEILFADLPIITKYRNRLKNIKWVHTAWNGVDNLMAAINKTSEPLPTFTLTKTLGIVNAPFISEYVIGYIIAIERGIFELKELQDKSEWGQMKFGKSRKLRNITIGFLGTGAIAAYSAKQCKALGMTVWGLSRTIKQQDESSSFDVHKTTEELPEFLQSCDFIVGILPSTPSTRGLLSGGVLEHCKHRKTVLINVGRGDLLDEDSIVQAMTNKWLSKAVLDVLPVEPLPQSSPLWTLPGVIITPHISGWSTDLSHYEVVIKCFVDNYHRYVNREPLLGVLDWEQGY